MDNRTLPAPRLAPLPPEHAPELREQFAAFRQRMGFIPNSLLIMQRSPKLAKGFAGLTAAIWDPDSTVDRKLKRLIAHVASRSAGCRYCMAHTAEGAAKLGVDQAKLDAVGTIRRARSSVPPSAPHWTLLPRQPACPTPSPTRCFSSCASTSATSRWSRSSG